MPIDDSICPRCQGDNLTDYPVCPACAKRLHFTHRLCACDACSTRPIIEIRRQPLGHYKFQLPFENDGFLDEFKTKIGLPFRTWHLQSASWNLKPLDAQMVGFVAEIIRRHFPHHQVRIVEEQAAAPIAA